MKTCLSRTTCFSKGMKGLLSVIILFALWRMLLLERLRWFWRVGITATRVSPKAKISRRAGQREMAAAQTNKHENHTHTCSRCNLWWQTRAGPGNGPGGVVITHFHCDHYCVCVWVCVISSLSIYHDQIWVYASVGLAVISLVGAVRLQDCLTGETKKSESGSACFKLSNSLAEGAITLLV